MLRLIGSLIILPLSLALSAADASEAVDCQEYLTGYWVGAGKVDMFGQSIEVDNSMLLSEDGTFKTINRFKTPGKDWQEQALEGNWSAEAGDEARRCVVTLSIEGTVEGGGSYSSSSQSTFVMVDDDTLTSQDFPMERTPLPES